MFQLVHLIVRLKSKSEILYRSPTHVVYIIIYWKKKTSLKQKENFIFVICEHSEIENLDIIVAFETLTDFFFPPLQSTRRKLISVNSARRSFFVFCSVRLAYILTFCVRR